MTHRVVSVKTFALVFAALIALTVTTVAVSKLELGEYNFICAMSIAVKAGSRALSRQRRNRRRNDSSDADLSGLRTGIDLRHAARIAIHL